MTVLPKTTYIDKEAKIAGCGFVSLVVGSFTTIVSCRILSDHERLAPFYGNLTYLLISTILVLIPGLVQVLSSLYLLCLHDFLRRWITINSYVFLTLIFCVTIAIPSTTGPYRKVQLALVNESNNNATSISLSSTKAAQPAMAQLIIANSTSSTDRQMPTLTSVEMMFNNTSGEAEDITIEQNEASDEEIETFTIETTTLKNDFSGMDTEFLKEVLLDFKLFYGVILTNFMFLPISLGIMAGIVETRILLSRSSR